MVEAFSPMGHISGWRHAGMTLKFVDQMGLVVIPARRNKIVPGVASGALAEMAVAVP